MSIATLGLRLDVLGITGFLQTQLWSCQELIPLALLFMHFLEVGTPVLAWFASGINASLISGKIQAPAQLDETERDKLPRISRLIDAREKTLDGYQQFAKTLA